MLEDAAAYPAVSPGFFDAQRVEVWTSRGDVLALTGQYEPAQTDFQAALEHSQSDESRAELYWRIGSIHEKLGQYDAALAALQKGIGLVEPTPQSSALPRLLSTLGWVFIRQGQPEQTRAVSMRSLALCKAPNSREAALALKSLGYAAFIQGDLNEAATHWQRSLSLVEQIGDQRELARVNNNLGMIAARRGRPQDAIAYFQRGLESSNASATSKRSARSITTWAAHTPWPGKYRPGARLLPQESRRRTLTGATRWRRPAAR